MSKEYEFADYDGNDFVEVERVGALDIAQFVAPRDAAKAGVAWPCLWRQSPDDDAADKMEYTSGIVTRVYTNYQQWIPGVGWRLFFGADYGSVADALKHVSEGSVIYVEYHVVTPKKSFVCNGVPHEVAAVDAKVDHNVYRWPPGVNEPPQYLGANWTVRASGA